MRKILKKLAISILIVITMSSTVNLMFAVKNVQADEVINPDTPTLSSEKDKLEEMEEGKDGTILTVADGIIGALLYGVKAISYAIINAIRVIFEGITALGGGQGIDSIEEIIFTGAEGFAGAEIVSVDFFDTSGNSTINTLRENIAVWYYALRNLSIVILLGILLYVGIRMAISTVASDEAKYKKMFKDWAVSLILVFVLHYIMIFTIELNNALVTMIHNGVNGETANWTTAMEAIKEQVWEVSFTVGFASLLVYGILVGVTMIYLFMYIKRMLTVAFLIVISPLITITYSIDKMGDGHSQALNTWLKEFVFNILIQPFHCIIYVVFVNVAIDLMKDASLSSSILAVAMLIFMHQAEKIIKNIFNFQSKSLAEAVGSTAFVTAGINFMKKQGDRATKKGASSNKIPNMDKSNNTSGGTNSNRNQSNTANNNMNAAENSTGSSTENSGGNSGGNANTGAVLTGQTYSSGNEGARTAPQRAKDWIRNKAKTITPGTVMKAAEKGLLASASLGAMIGLGAIGASTGTTKGIMSGVYAGQAINEGFGAQLNKIKNKRKVETNEQIFAGTYNKLRTSTGRTEAQMAAFTQQLLDGSIDTRNLTDEEAEYWKAVKDMKKTYSAIGEDDIDSRMEKTLAMINDGTITPIYNNMQAQPQASQQAPQQPQTPQQAPQQEGENNTPQPQNQGQQNA